MQIRRPLCLVCLVFLCICYIFIDPPTPSWDVDAAKGLTVTVTGEVMETQMTNGSYRVFLKDISYDDTGSSSSLFPEDPAGVIVSFRDPDMAKQYIRTGSRIRVRGVFEPFDVPVCEGAFDARTYYAIRGYEGNVKRASLLGVSKGYGKVLQSLRQLRDKAAVVLSDNMSEKDAGLVAAMTLGDRTELDPEIKELYQTAGISHVLALSGLHIASVGLAILTFLKKTGVPVKIAALISGGLIGIYAVMTGLAISTVRAMIMFSLSVAAILIGRTYDLLSAAALSALLILIEDPYYIYDTGFLLSFGAVVGIACIYPVFCAIPECLMPSHTFEPQDKEDRKLHSCIRILYRSVCVTLSVTIATLPVTGYSFMQISVLSTVINIVVIPLMGLVLFTGFAGIIVGLTGLKPHVILMITHYILSFYEFLARQTSKIDGNMLLTGQPSKEQIITYVLITATGVVIGNIAIGKKINNIFNKTKKTSVNQTGRHNIKNNDIYHKNTRNKITYITESASRRKKNRTKKTAGTASFIILIITSSVILTSHPKDDLEIRNVDVGQGDSALIWGDDIPVIMIDGGSTDIKQAGKYRIVPVLKANRTGKIDFCFLTHMDSDHVNSVLEILEDDLCPIQICKVVISEASLLLDPDNENLCRLLTARDEGKCEVLTISKGDSLDIGNYKVTCLSPRRPGEIQNFDANASSLVLRVDQKAGGSFSAVFTGDIGEETEKLIASELTDCVYLKVAHHGSKTSSSDIFLKKTSPEISVISVGEGNSYGHPSKEALARIQKTGSRIYRTDERGEVIVTWDEGLLSVKTVK